LLTYRQGHVVIQAVKHARNRVLSDDEIRAIWKGTEPKDRDDV